MELLAFDALWLAIVEFLSFDSPLRLMNLLATRFRILLLWFVGLYSGDELDHYTTQNLLGAGLMGRMKEEDVVLVVVG